MRIVAGAVLFLLSSLSTAFAQIPKANIFIGYSYMSADIPNASSRKNLNGWEGSIEGKVLPFLGIVADGSGHYGTTQVPACAFPVGSSGPCAPVNGNLYTALFGPRVSASLLGIRPFAHFLVGAADISGVSSDFSFASAVGGGVDLKLAPIIGWRFQGDYIHTHFSGVPQGHARISTGIVFRF
jgi:hypothetical protein